MLRITEERVPGRLVLKLEGRFLGDWVPEVDACWHAATAAGQPPSSIWVDLTDVCLVDVAGQQLLAKMHRAGVKFVARGCLIPELVRELSES
jgi:anti-anti-sigma regulatory factor